MSPFVRIALAVVALSALTFAQEPETRVERYPDGSPRCEYEVVLVDGEAVRDGKYASFHPDGSREHRGRYKDGVRHGTWMSWFPSGGRKRAQGKYLHGLRNGEWNVWLADGSRDERESGEYVQAELFYDDGAPRARGEALDGVPHGDWVFVWPHGGELARGEYDQGQQSGLWVFRHGDGFVDPGWISGWYEDGRHVRDPEHEELGPAGEARAWPPLGIDPLLRGGERELARRELVRFLEGASKDESVAAAERLRPLGRRLDALLLTELEGLDPVSKEDAARAHRIETHLLVPLCNWSAFGWREPEGPEGAAANALVLRRWKSLFSLARIDPSFLDFGLRSALPVQAPESFHDLARHPPPIRVPEVEGLVRPRPAALVVSERLARRQLAERKPAKGLREPIEAALAWLAAHQAPDGSWSAEVLTGTPELVEPCGCGGAGEPRHTPGITALALMALVVDGNTPSSGPHRRAVSRAVGYLLAQQDPKTGEISRRVNADMIYDHAIATQALIEVHASTRDEDLSGPIEEALRYIERARNPYGAWRYDVPPKGESDTSVTAWMISALTLARDAGFAIDEDALDGGLNWLDEVTDAASGRCGYDSVGSLSARVPGVNDHFEREHTEAMTAAALHSRLRIGQRAEDHPILRKHADLLLRSLPEWDPDRHRVDVYSWYHGLHAMHLMGGRHWESWLKASKDALLGSQSALDHEAGSWDPVGVWGYSLGRSGTTALAALTLQAYYRFEGPARAR